MGSFSGNPPFAATTYIFMPGPKWLRLDAEKRSFPSGVQSLSHSKAG